MSGHETSRRGFIETSAMGGVEVEVQRAVLPRLLDFPPVDDSFVGNPSVRAAVTPILTSAKIYLRMQEIMEDAGAYVWMNHAPEVFIHRADLKIDTSPSAEMNLRAFTKA